MVYGTRTGSVGTGYYKTNRPPPGKNPAAYTPPKVGIDTHLWDLLKGLKENIDSYRERKKQGWHDEEIRTELEGMETELEGILEEIRPLTKGKGWCYEVVYSALVEQYKRLRNLPKPRVGVGARMVKPQLQR